MTLLGAIRHFRRFFLGDNQARKEYLYRLTMKCRGIDLSFVSVEDLGIPKERSHWYSNSGGPGLDVVLSSLPISRADAALDIGCGKGGAMLTMAKYPFARVDGVEISRELVKIAQKNLDRFGLKNASIFRCDAADFKDLDPYSYLYMYNPFEEVVIANVVDNVLRSLSRRRRKLTLIYKAPVGHSLLLRAGFSKTNQFDHSQNSFSIYVI
jgi:SAM-dependent methyltransferase